MSYAPTAPVESAPPRENSPAATTAKPSRAADLLFMIRALIEIGRERLAAIRSQCLNPDETGRLATAFGTFNVAVIVARIMRGLRIAAALEVRVTACAARIDAPPALRVAATGRSSRPSRAPKPSDADDNAALLDRLPTDREIAAMVRGRPIGAVLVDICADLGIGMDHPLWQELRWIVIDHGGQLVPVLRRTCQRMHDAHLETKTGLGPELLYDSTPEHTPETTGPPLPLLAA